MDELGTIIGTLLIFAIGLILFIIYVNFCIYVYKFFKNGQKFFDNANYFMDYILTEKKKMKQQNQEIKITSIDK